MHQKDQEGSPVRRGRGRPPATSAEQIAHVGLALFAERGFDATTMDDVAAAVGIARRTLFSYYRSKSAIVWDGQREASDAITGALSEAPRATSWREAVVQILPTSLRYPGDDVTLLRRRLQLIAVTPTLQAHLVTEQESSVEALTAFIADRDPGDELIAFTAARGVLATFTAALLWWSTSDEPDPRRITARALSAVLGPGPS